MNAARLVALASSVLLGGCALAMPTASFGSTTPRHRTDVMAGGAVRVARGDLRAAANPVANAVNHAGAVDATGIVPMVAARYGLTRSLDLGVVASGTGARFDLRTERVLRAGTTRVAFLAGAGPQYTYVVAPSNTDGGAHLLAVEPTLVIAVDFGGLYEVWAGPRVSLGGLVGQFEDAAGTLRDARALRLDAGGVFGFAAGLRRVHGFVELSAMYEGWWGDFAGASVSRGGLLLLPAFGLRVRI